jgi:hypothetical protein
MSGFPSIKCSLKTYQALPAELSAEGFSIKENGDHLCVSANGGEVIAVLSDTRLDFMFTGKAAMILSEKITEVVEKLEGAGSGRRSQRPQ